MKRYRIFLSLFLIMFLFSILLLQVSAHPGKTDAAGGHYDTSTGTYHFHHGYPEHQHYDMDGDGIIDCPYDFEDKTDHSSSNNFHSENNTKTPGFSRKENSTMPDWIFYTISGLCITVICLILIIIYLINKLKSHEQEHKRELEASLLSTHNDMITLIDGFSEHIGGNVLYTLSGVPSGTYINENNLPAAINKNSEKWGNEYTFNVCASTHKFHNKNCRYSAALPQNNAWTILCQKYEPCQVCHPILPNLSWMKKYKQYSAIFQKYSIPLSK